MVLVENPEIVFRVMLSLLGHHREALLKCDSFESCMDYLKGMYNMNLFIHTEMHDNTLNQTRNPKFVG